MAIEIERKFLVREKLLPPLEHGQRIVQGYLCKQPQIRFRLLENKIVLTLKKVQPDGSRFELETETETASPEESSALLDLAIYPVVEKVRYRVLSQDLVWELDIYARDNAGLITVDVELPALDYPLVFPEWVAKDLEITHDPRYFNTNLGKHPYSKWGTASKS
ncbi:CYTH domain-containing protein [Paradesulfitobacterium aromaticivorans]